MITWGFIAAYGDVVTVDQAFTINGLTILGAYILVGTSGNIVWKTSTAMLNIFPTRSQVMHICWAHVDLSAPAPSMV